MTLTFPRILARRLFSRSSIFCSSLAFSSGVIFILSSLAFSAFFACSSYQTQSKAGLDTPQQQPPPPPPQQRQAHRVNRSTHLLALCGLSLPRLGLSGQTNLLGLVLAGLGQLQIANNINVVERHAHQGFERVDILWQSIHKAQRALAAKHVSECASKNVPHCVCLSACVCILVQSSIAIGNVDLSNVRRVLFQCGLCFGEQEFWFTHGKARLEYGMVKPNNVIKHAHAR
jgi:hypothetical protein